MPPQKAGAEAREINDNLRGAREEAGTVGEENKVKAVAAAKWPQTYVIYAYTATYTYSNVRKKKINK